MQGCQDDVLIIRQGHGADHLGRLYDVMLLGLSLIDVDLVGVDVNKV